MPEIVTWSEARDRGLPNYFSGIPCKRGHVSERTFSSGMCKECASQSNKVYAKEKAAEIAVWRKDYVAKNIERVRANKNAYRVKNKERVLEIERRAHAKVKLIDPDRYRIRAAQWAKENPDQARANVAIRRARQVGAVGSYTSKDVSGLFRRQNGLCAYCFIKVGKSYHVDHIVPLAKGGTNWPDNLQICCKPCNLSKGSKDHTEFLRYLGRAA